MMNQWLVTVKSRIQFQGSVHKIHSRQSDFFSRYLSSPSEFVNYYPINTPHSSIIWDCYGKPVWCCNTKRLCPNPRLQQRLWYYEMWCQRSLERRLFFQSNDSHLQDHMAKRARKQQSPAPLQKKSCGIWGCHSAAAEYLYRLGCYTITTGIVTSILKDYCTL